MSIRARDAIGPALILALALGTLWFWIANRPADEPTLRYTGEIIGAEAVLMFSIALVLVTLIPAIESLFNGMDRVARWHRNTAVAGVILMLSHPIFVGLNPLQARSLGHALAKGLGSVAMLGLLVLAVWAAAPRLSRMKWASFLQGLARTTYTKWLTAHRLTGLFLIAAVLHGIFVDPILAKSAPLMTLYLVTGGIGIAAYLYRELLARHVIHSYDYVVAGAERLNDNTLDLRLNPTGKPLSYRPGQFLSLALGGTFGWEHHPFTIDSSPRDSELRVTVKASGDYTRDLYDGLEPGVPAKVVGPFGRFDYTVGGDEQIWIAGGVGVTPFVSWIRALDSDFDRQVDFWYSVQDESEALFLNEFRAAAEAHPTLKIHLADTGKDGFLTADRVTAGRDVGKDTWVFLCGPPPMTAALEQGFAANGVPRSQIRYEDFAIR